ncbi:MAG: amidohydrolase family protein [Proteobacteria bacterium]|nr:amidohydrolase family protein [Pseudomonadota bacterium]
MRKINDRQILAIVVAFLTVACDSADDQKDGGEISVQHLLLGGYVIDGSGGAPYAADLGINDGRIAFIGNATTANVRSDDEIDVNGLWITPGFIDAHSHAELDKDYGRDALPYLYQGITTVVLGADGEGSSNVAERMELWRTNGIGTNGILYVGHGNVRSEVMGAADRAPTGDEMAAMQALVRKGMDEGAFGLSTGLFYVPGTYASTEEVITLAKTAAEYAGAIYDTHDRDLGAVYKGVGYDASVKEGIRITEESGLRGIFSHYNLQGAHNYGRADIGAKYINDARARGVDIWAAQHPYTATQSNLRSYTVPDWAAAGGQDAMIERFDDPELSADIADATNAMLQIRGGADKIMFVDPQPNLNGKTLAEVSRERELAPALAVQQILRENNKVVMNLELYDDDNTRLLAEEAWMMTCTDGRTPRPDQPITHPRTYGSFAKKMRMLVFDSGTLSAEFVIRSYSGLAADFFRMPDRGYLREGYFADLVVLDPEKYRDLATYESPREFSVGAVHVVVNGTFAIRNENATGALSGQPLTRP